MQFYRLVGKPGAGVDHPDNIAAHTFYPVRSHVAWVTSEAKVNATCRSWVSDGKVANKNDIQIEVIEISANKQELLAWLSANVTVAPGE